MAHLATTGEDLPAQLHRVRTFYAPLLESQYDHVQPRLRDLEQLEQLAGRYRSRPRMLREMALDPPNSTQDLAGPPHLDNDYLVLSTIHSAKGLEWDAVYVIHAADGNIPSDMATRNSAEIEEERRLFYVALTRAKNFLYVCCPLRYYYTPPPGMGDRHGYAQRTRFLPDSVAACFEQRLARGPDNVEEPERRAGLRVDQPGGPPPHQGPVAVSQGPGSVRCRVGRAERSPTIFYGESWWDFVPPYHYSP